VIAAVVFVLVWTRASPSAPPAAGLPAVSGQLGTHLRQLLQTVTK
jgi:hypothetical protein